MTVTRATLGRVRARLARLRASLPPVCVVVEPDEIEDRAALESRVAEARRRAGGRNAMVIVVDREDCA